MGLLDGKVAIVTGAGQGIGREHALGLAAEGARVVVNDLGVGLGGESADDSPAERVVAEIEAAGGEAVPNGADVADDNDAGAMIQQALDVYGRLDILVNNAGILRDRMVANMTADEWDAVMRVHLRGHFLPTRHAASHWRGLAKSGSPTRARVINTSSPSGVFGNIGQANYGAAKAGIAAITTISALELSRYGVTVNAIAPSARTRMTTSAFGELPKPEGGFDPLDPANVTSIVVALCADAAQGITGQCFLVWGGLVSVLRPWDLGPTFEQDGRWDTSELLEVLLDEYPDGVAPEGMAAVMDRFRKGRARGG